MKDVYEDRIICNCKKVYYSDIVKALQQGSNLSEIEEDFKRVQEITKASTGCGGCHDKVLDVISEILNP